jgi:hypothetical protein
VVEAAISLIFSRLCKKGRKAALGNHGRGRYNVVDHQEVVAVKFPTLHPKMHVGADPGDLNTSSS